MLSENRVSGNRVNWRTSCSCRKVGTYAHIGKYFLLTRDIKCSTALEIERGLKRSHACKVAKKIERRKAVVKKQGR